MVIPHALTGPSLHVLLLVGVSQAQDAAESSCSACHEQGAALVNSGHRDVACRTYHAEHEDYPYPSNILKPGCVQCHPGIAEENASGAHERARQQGNEATTDCGMSHFEVAEQYTQSVHGKAVPQGMVHAPTCADCHGEHSILSPFDSDSPVNVMARMSKSRQQKDPSRVN